MPAPPIPPVTAAERPRWSVMIPAWNSADFIAATIESVLSSDLPPGSQIEVVDDLSTDGTAAAVAAYSGAGVRYHVNTARRGAPANFNECLRRASGELVHLLHADDRVLTGFYGAAETGFAGDAVAVVTRCEYIDEAGTALRVTRSEAATGVWTGALDTLGVSNRIRPPAIAVRRAAYEAVGGYREDLPHAADWEAWVRLAKNGPFWFHDEALAQYRVHPGQDTSDKVRTGANIADRVATLRGIVAELPPGRQRRSLRRGLIYSALFAGRTAFDLARRREWATARVQVGAAARCVGAGIFGRTSMAPRSESGAGPS